MQKLVEDYIKKASRGPRTAALILPTGVSGPIDVPEEPPKTCAESTVPALVAALPMPRLRPDLIVTAYAADETGSVTAAAATAVATARRPSTRSPPSSRTSSAPRATSPTTRTASPTRSATAARPDRRPLGQRRPAAREVPTMTGWNRGLFLGRVAAAPPSGPILTFASRCGRCLCEC